MDKSWLEVEPQLSRAVPQHAGIPEPRYQSGVSHAETCCSSSGEPCPALQDTGGGPGFPRETPQEGLMSSGVAQRGSAAEQGQWGHLLGSLDWWTPPGLPSRSPRRDFCDLSRSHHCSSLVLPGSVRNLFSWPTGSTNSRQ